MVLDTEGKRVLLDVIDTWLAEPSFAAIPAGIRELRDELETSSLATGNRRGRSFSEAAFAWCRLRRRDPARGLSA